MIRSGQEGSCPTSIDLPWHRRWRTALLGAFLLVAVLVGLLEIGEVVRAYRLGKALALSSQTEVAQGLAGAVDLFVARYLGAAQLAAQAVVDASRRGEAPGQVPGRVRRAYPEIGAVVVMDWRGRVLASDPGHVVGSDYSDRDYFRQLAAGAPVAVSDLVVGRVLGIPAVVVAAAVRRRDGAFGGAVALGLPIVELDRALDTYLHDLGGASAVVVDRSGRLVLHGARSNLAWPARDYSGVAPAAAALAGRESRGEYRCPVTGRSELGVMVPIPSLGWVAGVNRPVEAAMAPAHRELRLALARVAVVLAVSLALALVLSRRLSRPIATLAAGVAALAKGDLAHRVEGQWRNELGRLAEGLNRMAERLDAASREERALAGALRTANLGLERRIAELEVLFLDANPFGIAIAEDAACRRVRISPAFARLMGIPPGAHASLDALSGERPDVRLYRDGRALSPDELPLQRAIATGRPVVNARIDIVRAGGSRATVLGYAAPLFDEDGRVRGALGAAVDVTDLRRAEEERERLLEQLGAERARLEAVVRQMPAGVVLAEAPSGRLVLGNAEVEAIWRRPFRASADIETCDEWRGFHPDGRPYRPDEWPLVRAIRTGEVVLDEEVEILRGDGTRGALRVNAAPIRDRDGRIVAGVVTFYDVTERRRAEAALRASEERYRLVARATNDVIWDWDLVRDEAVWNDALRSVFGYEADDASHTLSWWIERIHPEDRARVVSGVYAVIDGGGGSWSDEYRFRRRDGSYAAVLDRGHVARDERGAPVRMIGSMIDISERKRMEEALRFLAEASGVLAASLDHEATLAAVARLSVAWFADYCIIYLVEPDGAIRRAALAHRDAAAEPLLRELSRHQPPDPAGSHPVARAARSGRPELVADVDDGFLEAICAGPDHLRVIRRLGPRSFLVVPLVARGRTLGAISFVSAGSRRRYDAADVAMAEELARQAALAIDNARLYQDAQAAVRARDDFLARASHELRTPLTSAIGSIRLLERAATGQCQERPETLAGIAGRSLAAMRALVDDLLDASKLAAGRVTLAIEPVDVAALVRESIETFDLEAREKGVALRTAVPPGLLVPADRFKLEQVLVNLLANAIKFTPAGGEAAVEAEVEGDGAVIRVRDTGEGIVAEQLERIFEPFFQGGAAPGSGSRRVRRARGSGLGLAICRHIVTLHGGRIWAESGGPGLGSTFTIRLPAAQAGSRAA